MRASGYNIIWFNDSLNSGCPRNEVITLIGASLDDEIVQFMWTDRLTITYFCGQKKPQFIVARDHST